MAALSACAFVVVLLWGNVLRLWSTFGLRSLRILLPGDMLFLGL